MQWFQVYPLPADHWINTPLAAADHKTLLHLALEAGAGHAEQLARLLVTAGARADIHNEDLGLSPVHVAAQDCTFTCCYTNIFRYDCFLSTFEIMWFKWK